MKRYAELYFLLPPWVAKKVYEYITDGKSATGMGKLFFAGKLLEKAVASDIMGIYKMNDETSKTKKSETGQKQPELEQPKEPEPEPEPEPEWKAKWREMVAERNARKEAEKTSEIKEQSND